MSKPLGVVLLCLLWVCSAFAQSPAMENLKQRLEKKTLYVRGFPTEAEITYDRNGRAITPAKTGSWTYGQLYISAVNLTASGIEIVGKRVGQEFSGRWKERKTEERQSLLVQVPEAELTSQMADALVAQIFIPEREVDKTVSTDWVRFDPADQPTGQVYSLNGGIRPPRFLPTDTAKTDDSAKIRKSGAPLFTGTALLQVIINEKGRVAAARLQRPLGMGLSERALAGVREWRALPAEKNGIPVAVRFNLEINFNLY